MKRRAWYLPWLLPVGLLLAWQAATASGLLSNHILPTLSAVASAGYRLALTGELFQDIWVSTARAAVGFAIGGAIGFALGLLNGMSAGASRLFDSTVQMLRNIPHLALIPLVILWFGIDEQAKIFLVAFGVFFPIYVNTYHGVRTVDAGLIEMGRVYGLKRGALFRQIVFPGALPSILVGVRYALGFTWLTLIVAETISAQSGIGYMTMNAREFLQTDVVVLGILIYALLGKAADIVTVALERYYLAWHPAFRRAPA
jgi:sulfonate transport system permease protein